MRDTIARRLPRAAKLTAAMLTAGALTAGTAAPVMAGPVGPGEVVFDEAVVTASLTGQPGDAAEGRKAFADRKLGNCLACHENSEMSEQAFHGEVGTPLEGVGDRWTPAELRAIVANAKKVFGPDTVMPGFYTLEVGADVAEKFEGKTILSAQQVEDIVAYLSTLKE